MKENTFTSQRLHTRIKFEPLTTSCHLVCLTPQSPCTQVANTLGSTPEYEPDRSKTPTKIFPDVRANDPDKVFTSGPANKYLSKDDMVWYVNGKKISEVWKEGTDYAIDTSDSQDRGMLTVNKNIPSSEKAVLTFEGKFLDWRTAAIYAVKSNDMPLTTTNKGADEISCSVDKTNIVYNPLLDKLLLYEYKTARGITISGNRNSYIDGKCYEQTVNILLNSGTKQLSALPTGMSMRLVEKGTDTAIAANSTAFPEVTSISFEKVTFDMRMIDSAQYEVQFIKDNNIVRRATISLTTKLTMPNSQSQPKRAADLPRSMKVYFNSAVINTNDGYPEYPEAIYMIKWFTQAKCNAGSTDSPNWKYDKAKTWQRGMDMFADVSELGLGVTSDDSYFDIYFTADPHPKRRLLTLSDGTILTDKDGIPLID